MKGLVFNIETASLNDGPGIRTTVFMKGCPLDCLWCHNPESKSKKVQVFAKKAQFQNELVEEWKAYGINEKQELHSNKPVELSFEQKEKYQVSGRWWTVDSLIQQIIRDKPFFQKSGGGVTISGGEPLLQADFVSAVLQQLKQEKIHTCVDTSGFAPSSQLKKVLSYTDLFLFDIKAADEEMHRKFTGKSNQQVLQNLSIINQHGIPVIIRVPLVSGVNAVPEFLGFLKKLKQQFSFIEAIEILPYHEDYKGKSGCMESTCSEKQTSKKLLQEKSGRPSDVVISEWKRELG